MKKKLAFVLGIRPDVIRAALVIEQLRRYDDVDFIFIWSGQHYSDNLKDVFFRELDVAPPHVDLGARGESDAEVVASVIARLAPVLADLKPEATVFLGDTNTTTGAIASAQLNIPVVHIEGCMRSYDWRMPEEKYRTITDHLSDVIYAYYPEYKEQGVREGLNPESIVVVTNPIVDILQRFYFSRRARFEQMADAAFFAARGIERGRYYLMTCHRRENVQERAPLDSIMRLVGDAAYPVFFPASYRVQKLLRERGQQLPANVVAVDPIGYDEFVALMVNARGVLTDSGTVVEETCVLGVPSLQMRHSTERPQVYDVGSSVKFDPSEPEAYPSDSVFGKLEALRGTTWDASVLGDGRASERIADDLRQRLVAGTFSRHQPAQYHLPIARSFRGDGLPDPGA
jgi:UDP-N-acetylglucosamine 2-epimerase (non-hydrolysing)